jgi:hypothetical protein
MVPVISSITKLAGAEKHIAFFLCFRHCKGPARPGVNLNIISQTGHAANPPTSPLVGHPNISGLQA